MTTPMELWNVPSPDSGTARCASCEPRTRPRSEPALALTGQAADGPPPPIIDGTASEFDDTERPDFIPVNVPLPIPAALPSDAHVRQSRLMRRRDATATY